MFIKGVELELEKFALKIAKNKNTNKKYKLSREAQIKLLNDEYIIELNHIIKHTLLARDLADILSRVKNPIPEMQMAYFERCSSFYNRKNLCTKVQIRAVKRNPNLIKYIRKPCEDAQRIVIKSTEKISEHITSKKVIKEFCDEKAMNKALQ